MNSIGRTLTSSRCAISVILFLFVSAHGRQAMADDPAPDLSKECKYALLVGNGENDNEKATAKKGQDEIKEKLIKGWGFPSPAGFMHTKTNDNATKKDIEGDLDDIEKALEGRDPHKVENCVVKIHFQGHATKGRPDIVDKGVTPPDKADDHVGFDTAGGGHIWDFELVKHLQKMIDIMKAKKFKRQTILVQIDTCYAQGLVGKFAEEPPANMIVSWSSDKSSKCSVMLQPGQPTPFTQGFIDAFNGEVPPTAEQAEKGATSAPGIKSFNPSTKGGDPNNPKKIK